MAGWSDEQTVELVRLWQQGATVRQLAALYRTSPGAIAARLKRLRDAGNDIRSENPTSVRKRRKVRAAYRVIFKPPPPPPDACYLTFDQIRPRRQCMFPLDADADPLLFCGAPAVSGTSYCAVHLKAAYVKRITKNQETDP